MAVEIAGLLVFGAAQVGTPGPANMALMATGARFGLRPALPFVAGVALGKQLIIWPIGFGVMSVLAGYPLVFETLKWAAVLYIFWLAWKVAFASLAPAGEATAVPGFLAGLAVHPLNPKAWAMVITGFTTFVEPGTPALQASATVAISFLFCQAILHPLWCYGGTRLAGIVAGTRLERYLMFTLAALTVASVLYVVIT